MNEKVHKKAFQIANGMRKSNGFDDSISLEPPKQNAMYAATSATGKMTLFWAKAIEASALNAFSNGSAKKLVVDKRKLESFWESISVAKHEKICQLQVGLTVASISIHFWSLVPCINT